MLRSPTALAVVLSFVFLPGCNGNVEQLLDSASRQRLAAVPEGTNVLLSLTADRPPQDLPPLGGGRALGRTGNSVLLEVPPGVLPSLSKIDGLRSGTVWGPQNLLGRLDPGLLSAMLEAFDLGTQTEAMSMIARFDDVAADPRPALEGEGAAIGSMAGGIVTLSASPEAALSILALPHLIQLTKPKLQHPTPEKTSPDNDG